MICPLMTRYVEQSRNRGYGEPDVAQGNLVPIECLKEQCQCWVKAHTTGIKRIVHHDAHCGMVK